MTLCWYCNLVSIISFETKMSADLWASLQIIIERLITILVTYVITYFSFWVSYLIKLQANSQTQLVILLIQVNDCHKFCLNCKI